MQANLRSTPQLRKARACLWGAAGVLAVASLLLLRTAGALPAGDASVATIRPPGGGRPLEPMPAGRADLQPLLVKFAGRTLIRPAQVQAAVKTDGTAERLLKQLKLQGVVRIGDTSVAYIQVEKEGVKAVRAGDAVLEFVVESIEPKKVTLSLQGVKFTLGNG
jgi:hypothetical protein